MAIKQSPFQSLNFGESLKEYNGKQWVELKFNGGDTAYSFKEDDFMLNYDALAGAVVDGKHYLIAVLSYGAVTTDKLFEFKVWVKGADGKNSMDKKAGQDLELAWQKSGCLATLLVDDIPVLAALSRVLDGTKTIIRNSIKVNLKATEAKVKEIEDSLGSFIMFAVANGLPKNPSPMFDVYAACRAEGMGIVPNLAVTELPQVPTFDDFGSKNGSTVSCFPFEGDLPVYDKLIWTPPTVVAKKASGGWGNGGGSTTVNGFLAPDDKLKFIAAQFKNAGIPLESDDVAGIVKAKGDTVNADNVFATCLMILSQDFPKA